MTTSLQIAQIPDNAKIVFCNPGSVQALIKIIYDGKLTEIGKVEVGSEEKKEEKEIITLFTTPDSCVFIFIKEGVESKLCAQIMREFAPLYAKKSLLIAIGEVYKTKF